MLAIPPTESQWNLIARKKYYISLLVSNWRKVFDQKYFQKSVPFWKLCHITTGKYSHNQYTVTYIVGFPNPILSSYGKKKHQTFELGVQMSSTIIIMFLVFPLLCVCSLLYVCITVATALTHQLYLCGKACMGKK